MGLAEEVGGGAEADEWENVGECNLVSHMAVLLAIEVQLKTCQRSDGGSLVIGSEVLTGVLFVEKVWEVPSSRRD